MNRPSTPTTRHRRATAFAVAALLAAGDQAIAAGDAVAGKSTFRACASCHQVGPSARNGFGPALNGIVGKAAGSTPDYPYSAAMKASGIVWSPKTLAAFIESPDEVVPGTKMRFSSFGYSDRDIANLVAYLQTLSKAE